MGPLAARFTRRTAAAAVRVAELVRDAAFRALFRGDRLAEETLRLTLVFRGEDLRAGDLFVVPDRAPDLRERERSLPLFFLALDFLDVAIEKTP